uniref:Ovule protein n=1 Tax=Brugia timori TaxID=42155 RepID=A0A0R3R4I1_9BILA
LLSVRYKTCNSYCWCSHISSLYCPVSCIISVIFCYNGVDIEKCLSISLFCCKLLFFHMVQCINPSKIINLILLIIQPQAD